MKLLVILGLLNFVPGLAAFIWGVVSADIHSRWPTATGVITAVECHIDDDNDDTDDSHIVVDFDYVIADTLFHARQQWSIWSWETNSDGELDGYAPGIIVLVHYKPTSPGPGVINLDELDAIWLGGGFAFAALGVVILLFCGFPVWAIERWQTRRWRKRQKRAWERYVRQNSRDCEEG